MARIRINIADTAVTVAVTKTLAVAVSPVLVVSEPCGMLVSGFVGSDTGSKVVPVSLYMTVKVVSLVRGGVVKWLSLTCDVTSSSPNSTLSISFPESGTI